LLQLDKSQFELAVLPPNYYTDTLNMYTIFYET